MFTLFLDNKFDQQLLLFWAETNNLVDLWDKTMKQSVILGTIPPKKKLQQTSLLQFQDIWGNSWEININFCMNKQALQIITYSESGELDFIASTLISLFIWVNVDFVDPQTTVFILVQRKTMALLTVQLLLSG